MANPLAQCAVSSHLVASSPLRCACADPWPLGPAAKRPGPVPSRTQYAMLGEMGGMGTFVPGHTWAPPTSALNKGCFSYGHAFANTTEGEEQVYVRAHSASSLR